MNNSQELRLANGVYAALATPRKPNSTEADAGALLDYLDLIVRKGVDGLVLFGSTGEFVHFDIDERSRVLALAIRRSRVPVLVNVSHSSLAGAIALAENALTSGAAGLLLLPPYFFKYSQEQIESFYFEFKRLVGDKARIYLYNLPFFTSPIERDLARRLLESKAFAGIKDSSGDRSLLHALAGLRRQHSFSLLLGSEALFVEARASIADGAVSGVAAAIPELLVALERGILAGGGPRVEALNNRLVEFLAWVEQFPATVAIKQTAVVRGWKLDHSAFPLGSATREKVATFHTWLERWLPVVLAECAESTAPTA